MQMWLVSSAVEAQDSGNSCATPAWGSTDSPFTSRTLARTPPEASGARKGVCSALGAAIGWEVLLAALSLDALLPHLPRSGKVFFLVSFVPFIQLFLFRGLDSILLTNLYLHSRTNPFFNHHQLLETRSPVSRIHYYHQQLPLASFSAQLQPLNASSKFSLFTLPDTLRLSRRRARLTTPCALLVVASLNASLFSAPRLTSSVVLRDAFDASQASQVISHLRKLP